jgi:hypothetical protein
MWVRSVRGPPRNAEGPKRVSLWVIENGTNGSERRFGQGNGVARPPLVGNREQRGSKK